MASRSISIAAICALVTTTISQAAESFPVSQLSELTHIHGLAFDPADSTDLLIATHHGIYRASTGNVAERISGDRNDYMGFVTHPSDPNVLFASGHPETGGNLGFISSTDGGVSWTQVSLGDRGPVDFHSIAVSGADPNVIYGIYGGIQITTDGGASWRTAGQAPDLLIDLAASPSDPATLYVGTASGLKVSRDGGASWNAHPGPIQPASLVEFAPDGSMLVYFVPSGLHKAPPGGSSLELVAPAPDILLHLAVDPVNPLHLIAATQNSALLQSHDGGTTWGDLAL